ncbi:hypothetical protein LI177_04430 [bacterium 210820-DFI.6.37]|nr:hypothetical protein [bacterium 210820-DFI.6.37]
MIKLPKEVNQALKTLERAGYSAYAAGACVREALMGMEPLDWDIACDAGITELKTLFPEARVLSETESVIRIDRTLEGKEEDGIILDISTFQSAGGAGEKSGTGPEPPKFCKTIEEDLEGRNFTINAVADNPSFPLVDPWGGYSDMKEKLVRTIKEPEIAFEEKPILMMEAILLASELDFDLPKATYDAMIKKARLLDQEDVALRRETFKDIITAPFAGKGLRMLAGADLMPALIGEAAEKMSARQRELFSELADGIDKLKPVTQRRLGLFYMCFEKKGPKAIELLQYDPDTHQHLMDAMTEMTKIYFIRDKIELKKYIYRVGMERYDYVHNLAKAHRIVYPQGNVKVQNRHYMLEDVFANKEPIFIEDLAIDAGDIIEAGITDSQEQAAYLLGLLPEIVHRKPSQNKKDKLLAYARKFEKSKLKAAFRGVKWIK